MKAISIVLFCFYLCDGLKILQIMPGYSNSHSLFNYRLAKAMKTLGHDVTILNIVATVVGLGNHTAPVGVPEHKIVVELDKEFVEEGQEIMNRFVFSKKSFSQMNKVGMLFNDLFKEACHQQLENHLDLVESLRSENFDLALVHPIGSCPVGMAYTIGVQKVAWISPGTFIFEHTAWPLGIPTNPSTFPYSMSPYSDRMTFFQRFLNGLRVVIHFFTTKTPSTTMLYGYENHVFTSSPNYDYPSIETLGTRAVGMFINGQRILDFPRPLPYGAHFLGDFGEKKKGRKELKQKWKSLVENAEKGVIIFSFGSVANTSDMPENMKMTILNGLSRLTDYTIIWKFLKKDLPEAEKYSHIHLTTWIPQRELLQHPKTKLFISHGGYNSLLETTEAGIPVVMMPLFADQEGNSIRASRFGLGEVIDIKDDKLTADTVENTVRKVVENERYANNAKKLALMLEDRLVTPEEALDHNLRTMVKRIDRYTRMTAAVRLNFFQFYCLDVLLFWPSLFLLLCYLAVKIVRNFLRKCVNMKT